MKLSRLVLSAFTGLGLLFTSHTLLAQGSNDSGLYLGGSYGIANVNDSEFDDDNDVPQAFVGLQLNPFLGIEASYTDFGSYGSDLIKSDTDGYGLALTGTLPLTESFGIFAKAGKFWWDSEIEALSFSDNFDGDELYYGVGLNFAITRNLDFRFTYDRLDIELDENEIGPVANADFDSTVDILSAGVRLKF